VFADPERRHRLEAITHPLVAARTAELVAAAPRDAIVVHDVPLIVEKRMGGLYHLVLVVHAPAAVRRERLVTSRGMSRGDVQARIDAQATDAERRDQADVWLNNDREPIVVRAELATLWRTRLVPFEHNVRTRTRVRRPDDVPLVPYDPAWAALAARLAARVTHAAGELGAGVQHVGSTAVPGLAAKPVIDLQLGVRSLADADRLVDALADAGFPREPGVVQDQPHAALDPMPSAWGKRFHGGADPGTWVHLHVREVGSPGGRLALLLRDWWRADPAERAGYEAAKRQLRAAAPDVTAYADAKEPWFATAVPRALGWARDTGWEPGGGTA
jgi:dephospho-CoA kinase